MVSFEILSQAAALALTPQVFLVVICAGAFGMFVGAMPGLTATMATALLVPVTFFMEPIPAVAAIVTASGMAIFAGDIPGALLRMPGTPASAAYVEDSHRLALAGKLNLSLGTCLSVSALGGLFGIIVLIFAAPLLAEFALKFTSFEYFWLATLGLSCAIFIASDNPLKAGISLLLGLALATVGLDPASGTPRFTFGSVDLMAGIEFVPAMIGLFAMGEILRQGRFTDRIDIRRDGTLIFSDRTALNGDIAAHLARPAVAGGAGAMAAVLYAGADGERLLDAARGVLPPTGGASLVREGLLFARVLAPDSFTLRKSLLPLIAALSTTPLPRTWTI